MEISLAFIVVAVLEIVAIVDVLRSLLPTAKKILWILLIVIVPVIGFILYFLLGKSEQKSEA